MNLIFVVLLLVPAMSLASAEGEVGYSLESFSYKESLPAPFKSNETAIVFAPYGRFKFFVGEAQRNFIQTEAKLALAATSKYDGATLSDGQPVTGENVHHFFDGSGSYHLAMTQNVYFFTGLGFHYWDRYLRGGSGYREIYSWGYLMAGLSYLQNINDRFELGVEARVKQMFAGTIYIVFSETVENGDNTALNLGNKLGFQLSVPIFYRFNESVVKMAIRPFYAFSEIGESDIQYNSTPTGGNKVLGNIKEPASKTNEFGLQLGLVFPLQ